MMDHNLKNTTNKMTDVVWTILFEHRTKYNTIFTTITTTYGKYIPNKYLHHLHMIDHIYYLQTNLIEMKGGLEPNESPIYNSSHPTCGTEWLGTC